MKSVSTVVTVAVVPMHATTAAFKSVQPPVMVAVQVQKVSLQFFFSGLVRCFGFSYVFLVHCYIAPACRHVGHGSGTVGLISNGSCVGNYGEDFDALAI